MKRLLLIDPSPGRSEELLQLLRLKGYEVEMCSTVLESVEIIRKQPPDLILCSDSAGNSQAFTLLEMLNQDPILSIIPFILIAEENVRKERRRAMELGADDYLARPFREIDLFKTIERRLLKLNAARPAAGFNQSLELYPRKFELFPFELFEEEFSEVQYEKGDLIYRAAELPSSLYLIRSGRVKQYRIGNEGKELIELIHLENDYFGLEALLEDRPYESIAQAMEKVVVYIIPKSAVIDLLEHNRDAARNAMEYLAQQLNRARSRSIQLAYSSVVRRLILQLLELDGESATERIHVSRTDLAALIGTTDATLVRTLTKLRDEGVIDSDEESIWVTDREHLQQLAEIW